MLKRIQRPENKMVTFDFIKRNALALIITVFFSIWMIYLISSSLSSGRTIHFYNVLTAGDIVDVSDKYISSIPLERYLIEPFVGLTFIFGFENDPTRIIWIFLVFYLAVRMFLLVLDKTTLNRNRKKEVIFRYIKDVLEFFTKYTSIIVAACAGIILIALFTVGFVLVANLFETLFYIITVGGVILLILKGTYNAAIYFRPNIGLQIKKITSKTPVKKVLHRVKRELFYFWTGFLILFTFNFLFLSIRFPAHVIQPLNLASDEILIDFHVHTTMSDGQLSPEQRVLWYMDHGIQAAVFTDHHHPWGALRAKAFVEENSIDFTVLIGQEFTDDPEDIHLNILGIEEPIIPSDYYYEGPYIPATMNISQAINWTKTKGGYVIVNHYNSNASAPFSYDQLRIWGVDGFEIGTGQGHHREIRDYCLNNSLIAIGATDMHLNREIKTFVRLKLTDPTNRTLDHIMENLQRNNHSVIYIPELDYTYGEFKQLTEFHDYLVNLDVFQALSWIIWSCIGFCSIMLVLRKIKKINLTEIQTKLRVSHK